VNAARLPRVARLGVLLLLMAFFVALSFSAVAVGMQAGQSSSFSAFADFGGCAMPCWQGIQPGITGQLDALTRIDEVMGFPALQVRCTLRALTYCVRYTWMPQDVTARAAEMQIIPGQTEAVVVYNPGFTVGEALLVLHDLHVDFYGASQGYLANERFYVQLLFADSRLVLRAVAACSGSYYDLIEAPVRSVEVRSTPIDTMPVLSSFVDLRQSFAQLCGMSA
jgi:hypothetical protein